MARPPASAPKDPSNKRKCTPTTSTIPKPPTTTLTPAHFARLSAIWALDRRIPTPASRAAWAAARSLYPEKVHKWWYRCRARAKKMEIEIPEGSYEMEVGDVEAEEEEERMAREEREERVKKELEEDVEMKKGEEKAQEGTQGKDDTVNVAIPPQTSSVPTLLPLRQVLMEVDEAMETSGHGVEGILAPSPITPSPPATLHSSPMPTSSPLTLSQCFLPPSSPFTSPPPRSAPSPPGSPPPPPDLPRLTRASKRLYIHALEPVPASKPAPLDDDGKCTLTSKASAVSSHTTPVEPLTERRASQIENALCRCEFLTDSAFLPVFSSLHQLASNLRPVALLDVKPTSRKPKKPAHRPAKTTITGPKTSNPSRKRPPRVLPQTTSHSSLPLSRSSKAPSSPPLANTEIDDPMPTPADLERALYEGITFTPCFDISLSAVPFLFGLDACAFQFGGASNSGSLDSGTAVVNASWADTIGIE
ncbi:hypothetical protein DFP72DRAFT_1153217 [Ephemerocybe angulata]|uniref:Uncharacterized protein n=1 Tax=Ephemerocybe angulata TaxID=980116 RepID=A0A8H6HHG8_9AGAR|nr:hypothetical protein DFP72DRAFT_1153217 [Tulosesus angulatus]